MSQEKVDSCSKGWWEGSGQGGKRAGEAGPFRFQGSSSHPLGPRLAGEEEGLLLLSFQKGPLEDQERLWLQPGDHGLEQGAQGPASSFHGTLLALTRIWSLGLHGQEAGLKETSSRSPFLGGSQAHCAYHFIAETSELSLVPSWSQRLPGELDVDLHEPEGTGG